MDAETRRRLQKYVWEELQEMGPTDVITPTEMGRRLESHYDAARRYRSESVKRVAATALETFESDDVVEQAGDNGYRRVPDSQTL